MANSSPYDTILIRKSVLVESEQRYLSGALVSRNTFPDGSVHFLAYSADSILLALAIRAGGVAVTVPD
jgi:hypothetical protein